MDDRLNQANGIIESIGAYINSVADKATEPGREGEADSNYNQIRNILGEMKGTRKILDERRD